MYSQSDINIYIYVSSFAYQSTLNISRAKIYRKIVKGSYYFIISRVLSNDTVSLNLIFHFIGILNFGGKIASDMTLKTTHVKLVKTQSLFLPVDRLEIVELASLNN